MPPLRARHRRLRLGITSRPVISSSTKMRWSRLISSFVLGGAQLERAAEAGDFWLEGWARRSCSRGPRADDGETALRARGLTIPVTGRPPAGLVVDGVPDAATRFWGAEQENDRRAEARSCAPGCAVTSCKRIISVTSRFHTARAELVRRRYLAGTGIGVNMRASRHDATDVDRWWATRHDLRFALFEAQKFPAYGAELAD